MIFSDLGRIWQTRNEVQRQTNRSQAISATGSACRYVFVGGLLCL